MTRYGRVSATRGGMSHQFSQRQFKGWAGRQNHLKIIVGDLTLAARGLEERRNFEELLTESVGRLHFS